MLIRPPGHRRDVALRPAATAMVWVGAGHPHETIAVPGVALADRDVLVAVELSTICGSDVHTVQGRRAAPTPLVLGHESVGRVIATGDAGADAVDGTPLRIGDRALGDVGGRGADQVGQHQDARAVVLLEDVFQAALLFVENVFALAGAKQAATDFHFVEINRQVAVAVIKSKGDPSHAQGFHPAGTIKDDVAHAAAAEAFRALFSQHPPDRIEHIGLTTTIRAHDNGDARVKIDSRFVSKTFKSVNLKALKKLHGGLLSGVSVYR